MDNMTTIRTQLQSILFVASKPLAVSVLVKHLGVSKQEIEVALEGMVADMNRPDAGIHLLHDAGMVQFATNPACDEMVRSFIKEEASGELTRAQLETLTVVAYCGPMTRPEIEEIRGVNCAVILRNLMIRGLVEITPERDALLESYHVTTAALAHLGIASVQELPEYETLHAHAHLEPTEQS